MENIFIRETWVNRSDECILGETDVYETFTGKKGELFKELQDEYGRCLGKAYIDDSKGKAKQIGWVFEKKQKYEDANEFFILETWVTIH